MTRLIGISSCRFMRNFGFSERWCHWIFQFVSTVSFSILLNGSPYGFFGPKCGLRQDDPLSSFLFVLATEVLTWLVRREEDRGGLHGIQIARSAPPVTNLLFVGDIVLFCRVNNGEVRQLHKCLQIFARWSSQIINTQKSFLHFNNNHSETRKAQLGAILRLQLVSSGFLSWHAP